MRDSIYDSTAEQWYPADYSDRVVAECLECEEDMYEGDSVIYYDGMYFCSIECLYNWLGVERVELKIEEEYF